MTAYRAFNALSYLLLTRPNVLALSRPDKRDVACHGRHNLNLDFTSPAPHLISFGGATTVL